MGCEPLDRRPSLLVGSVLYLGDERRETRMRSAIDRVVKRVRPESSLQV